MSSLAEKVAYVKAAGQSRDHACHWPGCREQVPPAVWGCRRHWYALPLELRRRIFAAFRPGQEEDGRPSSTYLAVAREAQAWIRAHLAQRPQQRELGI